MVRLTSLRRGARPRGWSPSPAAGSPAKAGGPAYPLCTQWAGEGRLRPPFEPPASRAAAEAPDGRGRSPRTPTPVRARRSGAPLWSLPTTQAEQVAFDQAAEALRLPNAGERASEAVSAARELSPDPPASPSRTAPPTEAPPTSAWTRRRRDRTPSRRDSSRRRRGLGATPNHE